MSAASKKTASKKAAPAKASKPVAKKATKPTSKATAKPASKKATPVKAAKPVAKKPTPAKPVKAAKAAKAAPAKASKPASKAVAKPAIKAVAKPAAKPTSKAATKPAAKKAAPLKATKPVAKKAAPAKAAPAKAAPTKASKPAAKLIKPTTPAAESPAPVSKKVEAKPVQSTAFTPAPAGAAVFKSTMPLPVLQSITPTVKKDPKRANHWKTKPLEQLVDEDIIAMSENEYMNDVQMAYFRRKLVELKQGILANAGQTTENLREDTVIVPDPADRATIEEEHALELRTRDRERKLLKKIEQSIERIDAGEYGYCDETGEPIGVPRLLARPTASLSLEAQQRRELKQKMYGD